MTDSLFEIDSEGFESQQKGRDPYELVREAVQNALDTESDIEVIVDYDSSTVTVKDKYEDGVQDLEELWTLFDGDKASDPEQRGRFGRGVKELIAGSVKVWVYTTGGKVVFDVENNQRTVDEDECTDVGTEIKAVNPDWTNNQLTDIRDFIEQIWVPEGLEIKVTSLRGGEESTTIHTHDEPEREYSVRLKTVVVDDRGVMQEEYRDTTVQVKEDALGGIYEMGIPVTTSEDFNYILNVQQKIPMAEQREEPKSMYRSNLVRSFLNNCLDLLEYEELEEDWIMEEITSHTINPGVKDDYIQRRHPTRFSKGNVVSAEGPQDDFARQKGYNIIRTSTLPFSYKNMLESRLKSSEDIYHEFEDEAMKQVEPDDKQREFINFVMDNLIPHVDMPVQIEVVQLEQSPDTRARTTGDKISLNAANRDWDEINQENIGVVLHELAHVASGSEEHDMEFIHDFQNLAGKVVIEKSKEIF